MPKIIHWPDGYEPKRPETDAIGHEAYYNTTTWDRAETQLEREGIQKSLKEFIKNATLEEKVDFLLQQFMPKDLY